MRRVLISTGFLLAFGAGWMGASLVPPASSPRVSPDWYSLAPALGKESIPILEAKEVVLWDLELDIKRVVGLAKFIDDGAVGPSALRLGYKVTVEVAPLDLSTVPEKYRKETPVDLGGGVTLTQLPIDSVTYEVSFGFTLKDRDGFALSELKSDPHQITSGRTEVLQGFALNAVPIGIASRSSEVVVMMLMDKCVTCEGE